MRNVFFVIILICVYFIAGIFIVDSKEVGVIFYNTNKIDIYETGVHWKAPLYSDLQYIDKTTRVSYSTLARPYQFKNGSSANASVVITWQVVNFKTFRLLNDDKNSKFNEKFVNSINQLLVDKARNSNNLMDFMNNTNSITNLNLTDFGVKLISLNLINVKASWLNKNTDATSLSLESAYNYAQQIKSQAESTQQLEFNKMKQANNKFYTYYMTINAYQESATSRAAVPPLTSIIAK